MLNSHPNRETKRGSRLNRDTIQNSHLNRETMVKDYAVDAAMGCKGLRMALRSEENGYFRFLGSRKNT